VTSRRTAHIAAVFVIACAGALSALWAFLVPIFQSPDEAAHFDYAMSIADAHRLVRRADGPSATIVTPQAGYLLRISDFARIAGHSPMHVVPGYGTTAYYRALDASAPRAGETILGFGRISYIARLYPFGFYGLEALVIGAVTSLGGPLATTFFAARLLCVALMLLALFFSYRTALNLGVAPWTAVALTGAVGLFPMVSMVSSYVQPDNLAFAALSAALFFATQLRSTRTTALRVGPLGVALGILAVTKYQFFLSAALPIAAMLAIALRRQRTGLFAVFSCAVAFVLPAVGLLAVQHWYVDGATALARTGPQDIGLTYVRDVAALGIGTLAHYVVASLAAAFLGCWVSGICAAGYWGVAGWSDTPIVVASFTTETLLRMAISLVSLATAVIVAFVCLRNALRLLRVALRGHALRALWVAVSDPAIDGYLIFAAVIVALYVATNDVFGLSGRHWYPYVFVGFLCFVWYAPHALRGRRAATTSAALASVLFLYSLLAAGYALRDVMQRYYGPDTGSYTITTASNAQGVAIGAMWPLQDSTYLFAPSHEPFAYPRGTPVEASGSALQSNGDGSSPVAVLVDSAQPLAVLARQYLFGIAEATHSIGAGYSGFSAVIDTTHLAYGPHIVAAYARNTQSEPYRAIHPARTFFVTAAGGAVPASFRQSLRRAPHATMSMQPLQTCRGALYDDRAVVTVGRGSVLLVRGTLSAKEAAQYRAAWMIAGSRPYPARLDGPAFVALLPTGSITPGELVVSLYAQRFAPAVTASLGEFPLRVAPSDTSPSMRAGAPAECADPLKELAQ
jgi:hypothetical protein